MNTPLFPPIRILTVIVPCYNEESYIRTVVERLRAVQTDPPVELDIVVVNDGSTDATRTILEEVRVRYTKDPIRVIHIPGNRGKGFAIRSALPSVRGEAVMIQDADLEYDPQDIHQLLTPLQRNEADVVIGSRFRGPGPHKGPFFLHKWVNKIYTLVSNLLTGQRLTDIHSCYKLFRTDVIRHIPLKEDRFGFDPEVIARLSHMKEVRVREVGITYRGRNFKEGKKIHFADGFRAFYCIIRYNLFPGKKGPHETR